MFTDTLNKVTQGMTSHTAAKPTGVGSLPSVSKNYISQLVRILYLSQIQAAKPHMHSRQFSLPAHLVGM